MKRYAREECLRFGIDFLTKRGAGPEKARIVAETAVNTQAMGIHTHGLAVLPYLDQNMPDPIDPKAEPKVVRETGATALIDANNGFSQLALNLAGKIAERKAADQGVAMIGIRRCGWLGALGPYLVALAQNGFMAQLWAQTTTCRDCAPLGGIEAKFSTNPVAFAFPTAADPVLSDFSTATISMGRLNTMIRNGQQAPEPIFLDKNGETSRDPKVVPQGGTILFLGGANFGHKGYGLSLWCEALAALAGGECNNPETETLQSVNLTVVDPEAFAGRQYFLSEIERFKAHMLNNRVRPGFDRIRLPGERLFQSIRQSESEGVPLHEDLIARLNEVAERNGIAAIAGT